MSSSQASAFELPSVPASHKDFVKYIGESPRTSIQDFVRPYNDFEAKLREGFAQHRDHQAIQDPNVNAVPIFDGREDLLCIKARSLNNEVENEKFIMPLKPGNRKPGGAPAVVQSLGDFKKNFNLFSESSLVDLDWNNVVAAGSSVVTPLLPVPGKYNTSKKALRYVPNILCDLFCLSAGQPILAQPVLVCAR